MAIVVDSSQWTGEADDTPLATPIVWGEFGDEAELRRAAERAEASPMLREAGPEAGPPGRAANDQVDMPDENPAEADARNQRQLHVGSAMAATSMAAAGIVIATGGTALPAVLAATAAGAATGVAGEVAGMGLEPGETTGNPPDDEPRPQLSGPALGLKAATERERERAEAFLRECGARRIWVQETRAG